MNSNALTRRERSIATLMVWSKFASAHCGAPAEYLLGCLTAIVSTAIARLIAPWAQLADLVIVYLLGVIAVAARFALAPSLVCAMLSILAFDYFFIPPYNELAFPDPQSALTFFGMLVVAGVVSGLSRGLRHEREAARASETRTLALRAFGEELASMTTLAQLRAFARKKLGQLFDARVCVAICASDSELDWSEVGLESELSQRLAQRAWTTREIVHDPEEGDSLWLPLVGSHRTVGVVGLWPFDARQPIANDWMRRLTACALQLAGAIERALLSAAAHRAELLAEAERARGSLLAAISHDIKTPLSCILMAATTLENAEPELTQAARRELVHTLVDEAERLTHLVSNLLAMTRLEGTSLQLRQKAEEVPELVDAALRSLGTRLGTHRVNAELERGLPLVEVDALLIQRVLVNLLENAARHSPPGSCIEITARLTNEHVLVRVRDEGVGIPLEEREKVFEKFFRGSHAARRDGGVGLGLTICRAAVQAHGGKIYVCNDGQAGASIEFTLPLYRDEDAPLESDATDAQSIRVGERA